MSAIAGAMSMAALPRSSVSLIASRGRSSRPMSMTTPCGSSVGFVSPVVSRASSPADHIAALAR